MKNYLVIVIVQDPFEKKFEITASGSSAEVAQIRALRTFRKKFWQRRPLVEFRTYVKQLG